MKYKIAVVGLGYVGLPLAVAFSKKYKVIGFDINQRRINELNNGNDATKELTSAEVLENLNDSIIFTSELDALKDANLYIITVPTPIDKNKKPNLKPVINATESISKYIDNGDIIVFESTVYPGVTEEVCVPILERTGKKLNKDFFVGYSPERINPGDKKHTITKIKKVVSGSTPEILEILSQVYGAIIEAGVHRAESIKVAEAAKVIENTQRDINIAFINELAVIFDRLNIDTKQVLKAAATKWNFINFTPGLVGGHCIGVDPYYLAHKSNELGYNPEIILSGRRINDSIPTFIVKKVVQTLLSSSNSSPKKSALILGATFKENCPDIRNSKVSTIYKELISYGITSKIYDPIANINELNALYPEDVIETLKGKKFDIIILAVAHSQFLEFDLENHLNPHGVVFDVKGIYPIEKNYLRL